MRLTLRGGPDVWPGLWPGPWRRRLWQPGRLPPAGASVLDVFAGYDQLHMRSAQVDAGNFAGLFVEEVGKANFDTLGYAGLVAQTHQENIVVRAYQNLLTSFQVASDFDHVGHGDHDFQLLAGATALLAAHMQQFAVVAEVGCGELFGLDELSAQPDTDHGWSCRG